MRQESGDPQSAFVLSTLVLTSRQLELGMSVYVGRHGKKDKLASLTIAEISYIKVNCIHIGGQ